MKTILAKVDRPYLRRVFLILASLGLIFFGWTAVGAEDGFYVIPTMKQKYAPVPKTGQTQKYATGDDGDLEKGVAWPDLPPVVVPSFKLGWG
jgi:hypothetical protein